MSGVDVVEKALSIAVPHPSPTAETLVLAASERWSTGSPLEFVRYEGVAQAMSCVREQAVDLVLVDEAAQDARGVHEALAQHLRARVVPPEAPRGGDEIPEIRLGPEMGVALETLHTLATLGRRIRHRDGEISRLKSRLRLHEDWVQTALAREADRRGALADADLPEALRAKLSAALPELPPALLAGRTEGRRVSRQRSRPEQLAREVQRLLGAEAAQHEVRVDVEGATDVPRIWCDRREVVHALAAATTAAVRSAERGGRVWLRVLAGAQPGEGSGCRFDLIALREGSETPVRIHLDTDTATLLREAAELHGGRVNTGADVVELSLPSDPRSRRAGVRVAVVTDPAFTTALTEALLARGTRALFAPPSVDPARLAERVLAGQETVLALHELPEALRVRLEFVPEGEEDTVAG